MWTRFRDRFWAPQFVENDSHSSDHSAIVRDLWARKVIGIFTGNYTSPKIDSHAVMILNITLTK